MCYSNSELIRSILHANNLVEPMQTLSIEDIEQLNQSIFRLYTLRNLDTFGLDALEIVDRLVPGELPMFSCESRCHATARLYLFRGI